MLNHMWINGEPVESASKQRFEVVNPATEETITTVPRGNAEDVERAVTAANAAFKHWRKMGSLERKEMMHEIARKIRARGEELAQLITLEGGKPIIENRDEVEWVASCFEYYAELGRDQIGRVVAPVFEHQMSLVIKEPFGVVGAIVPWNYPILLMSWKVAPALAAGNTVVLKPSELTPLCNLFFAEIFDHLPKGVVNIVCGFGKECGEPMVTSKGTHLIAFTGSVDTGRHIAMLAAQQLKKVHLELGGNDPFIVCDDVDVDTAVRAAAWTAFLNNGQVCTSAERFYVLEPIAKKFIEGMAEFSKTLRLGNPMGPDVDLGPLVSDAQRQKVEARLAQSIQQGAKIVSGGKRPAQFSKGYFFEPTVLTHVDENMALMQSETFGPIAPIQVVKDIEEAIARANNSEYGLGASILTNDLEKAMLAAENIKAGTFWINDPLTDNDAAPFGGMRLSGHGRELGIEGLDDFREAKHILIDYKLERKGYWFPYRWEKHNQA
ncbi:MAG: aldehyde dehydrogenase family protein [bacterium]